MGATRSVETPPAPDTSPTASTFSAEPKASSAASAPSSSSPSVPAGPLHESAEWIDRDGAPVLAVVPVEWLRHNPGGVAAEESWARIAAEQPEANEQKMRDQYVCHVFFAPDKPVWYLEPWRPDVGYGQTVLAGCNPVESDRGDATVGGP